jgi:hypothetical protein
MNFEFFVGASLFQRAAIHIYNQDKDNDDNPSDFLDQEEEEEEDVVQEEVWKLVRTILNSRQERLWLAQQQEVVQCRSRFASSSQKLR